MKGYYICDRHITAIADTRMDQEIIKKFWKSFCQNNGTLAIQPGDTCSFVLGKQPLPTLTDGKEYVLTVTEQGAAVCGKDYGGLMRGFLSLLMKFECTDEGVCIQEIYEESSYRIQNRMIHICVFPENDLYFIKKLIRLAALCQYTHIVIEFWGMLKYDCMKELSWPQAFTKAQAKELIDECHALGIEPIPMFNQLGHATASRLCYGKHVVLDQNPALQYLFTPDGWAWNIRSEKVFALLKAVRAELCALFGEGEYLHIGCDEAYYYTHCPGERAYLPEFLHRLTSEVAAEGRRPMLWMDMLLEANKYPECYTVCPPDEVETMMAALHPQTVAVDWQYDTPSGKVASLEHLAAERFDTVGAPWANESNYKAHIRTIEEHQMYGIMLTTWHTLKQEMPSILGCAKACGAITFPWSKYSQNHTETAAMLRKVSFEVYTYADCGWSKTQIEV